MVEMALDQRDAFKDMHFDGKPSGYREFRRKVLLGIAGRKTSMLT